MASKYRQAKEVDKRALWERPVVRRLVTKDAAGSGGVHDEGQCNVVVDNAHSCKYP